jgi:putative inorganic carbon (HCO3(-)) transporter
MPTLALTLIVISLAPFALYLALKRPLIFPFGLYLMMVPFDGVIGATKVTAIVAGVTGFVLLFNMILTRRVLAPPKSWTGWALYTLLASLTALWTIDSNSTIAAIVTLLQLFVFFTILAVYPAEREDVRIVGGMIVASGTFISMVGLFGYAQGFRTQEDRLSVALNGLLIDPNHIAAALLLPMALAVGTLVETRNLWLRLGSAVGAMIMVTALFLTGSRGGLIALAIMLLYLAWKTRYRLQILALMGLAGVASLLQPTVWDRFADKGLGAGSGRLFIWNAGGLALKDHWLTGAGLGAFPAAYNHELLAMYQPVFQGWSRPAHNAVLSAAVELGIFGAALLLYACWRTWNDARGNAVIEAALVGLAVASLFLDVMLFKYIWLALSMAMLVKNAAEPKFLRGMRRQPIAPARVPAWRGARLTAAQRLGQNPPRF